MFFDVIWMEVEMVKMRVGIVFGGKLVEYEVLLQLVKNIVEVIDKLCFDVVLLGIDKQGLWYINDVGNYLFNVQDFVCIVLCFFMVILVQILGCEVQQLINVESG